MTESVKCPDCGHSAIVIGAIPDTDLFAGKRLKNPLPGGSLWRCNSCSLGFRYPQQAKENLDTLYANGHNWGWNSPPISRYDWNTAHTWIKSLFKPGSALLDIGCFDGGFLASLQDQYDCYGIEIHPVARERAEQKGIKLWAADFSDLSGQFDLITAFDVIEHMHSPAAFLRMASSSIRPGGMLLLSTGNLDSRTFQLLGSRYWYCTIAEHISFISPLWILNSPAGQEFKVIRQEFFAHKSLGRLQKLRQSFLNISYRFLPSVFRRIRKLGFGGVIAIDHPQLADHPPDWSAAQDHFIVLLQKV